MTEVILPTNQKASMEKARPNTSPTRSKVAVLHTRPSSVLEDIGNVMAMADYRAHLPNDLATLLKINISWQHYYPACSTTPWQLEGTIKAMHADGYGELIPAHNGTVVVDPVEGTINNKHINSKTNQNNKTPNQEKQNINKHNPPTPNKNN